MHSKWSEQSIFFFQVASDSQARSWSHPNQDLPRSQHHRWFWQPIQRWSQWRQAWTLLLLTGMSWSSWINMQKCKLFFTFFLINRRGSFGLPCPTTAIPRSLQSWTTMWLPLRTTVQPNCPCIWSWESVVLWRPSVNICSMLFLNFQGIQGTCLYSFPLYCTMSILISNLPNWKPVDR